MTASGVRSSWLTSARRRRRVASSDSRRAAIALKARLRPRSSPRPAIGLGHADRVVGGLDPAGRVDELGQRAADAPREPDADDRARSSPTTSTTRPAGRARSASGPSVDTKPSRFASSHRTSTPTETMSVAIRAMKQPKPRRIPPRRQRPLDQASPAAPSTPRSAIHRGGPRSRVRPSVPRSAAARPRRRATTAGGVCGRMSAGLAARRRGSRRRRRSARSAAGSARARACGGCS